MKEPNDLKSEYISVLLEKQVKKIISENNVTDPYFTIRENFDIDQFVWDIAVYIYKSSGYNVDLVKTNQLILEHQSSAVALYQKEQEKARLENLRIQAEQKRIRLNNSNVEKERIQTEIKNLENEKQKVSGQYFSEIQVLQKISHLQQQEIDILKEEEEDVLQQIQRAERDYDLNRASELRFEKLSILQQQIIEKEAKSMEIQSDIKTKIKLEQERITKLQEQERIKQEEQDKLLLEQIVPLLESQAELGGSIFKAKVYLCLIRIIAEDFDTDENCIQPFAYSRRTITTVGKIIAEMNRRD